MTGLIVALTSVNRHDGWILGSRIIDVKGHDPRDRALIGVECNLHIPINHSIKKIPLKPGILCSVEVLESDAESAIQTIAEFETVIFNVEHQAGDFANPMNIGILERDWFPRWHSCNQS